MRWLDVIVLTSRWVSMITAACLLAACLGTVSAIGEDRSDLQTQPKDGYVEVNLQGEICRLIPNGDKPGLCDIQV